MVLSELSLALIDVKCGDQMNDLVEWQTAYREYKRRITAAIEDFASNRHRLAFALACNERALPNYAAFQRQARWGNFWLLIDTIDILWCDLINNSISQAQAQTALRTLDGAEPYMEEFRDKTFVPNSSSAQDCVNGIRYSLEYIMTLKTELIIHAALCNANSVDQHLESAPVSQDLLRISDVTAAMNNHMSTWLHPLMQREINAQFADAEFLGLNGDKSDLFRAFRGLVRQRQVSTLGFKVEPGDYSSNFGTAHSWKATGSTESGELWTRRN